MEKNSKRVVWLGCLIALVLLLTNVILVSAVDKPAPLVVKFLSPLTTTGQKMTITENSIGVYLANLYQFALQIIGLVALLMMTIGGVQWLMANGNASKISGAKETILGALTGLLLALGTWTILNLINPNLVNVGVMKVGTIEKDKNFKPIVFGDISEKLQMESSKVADCKEVFKTNPDFVYFSDSEFKQPAGGATKEVLNQEKYCSHFFIAKKEGDKFTGTGQCDYNGNCSGSDKCVQTISSGIGVDLTSAMCKDISLNSAIKFCEQDGTKLAKDNAEGKNPSTLGVHCGQVQGIIQRSNADRGYGISDFECNFVLTNNKNVKDNIRCMWCPKELYSAMEASFDKSDFTRPGCSKPNAPSDLKWNATDAINRKCFENFDNFITKIEAAGYKNLGHTDFETFTAGKGHAYALYDGGGSGAADPLFISDELFNACNPELCFKVRGKYDKGIISNSGLEPDEQICY